MSAFSKGMRQKVLLSAALLHDPEIVILDEPSSGLDVAFTLILRRLVMTLAARGKTIIYSSHEMDMVEKICNDVVILHKGNVVAHDSVTRLREIGACGLARRRVRRARRRSGRGPYRHRARHRGRAMKSRLKAAIGAACTPPRVASIPAALTRLRPSSARQRARRSRRRPDALRVVVHGAGDDAAADRGRAQVRAVCLPQERARRHGLADCHRGASVLRSVRHAGDSPACGAHLGRAVSGSARPGNRRGIAGQTADAGRCAAGGSAGPWERRSRPLSACPRPSSTAPRHRRIHSSELFRACWPLTSSRR